MIQHYNDLSKIAITAAQVAGSIIGKSMSSNIKVEHKIAGDTYASQVVTEIDIKCDAIIREYLEPSCNEWGIALLTEEKEDDGSRFMKDFFWCVDPMDGTLAFINGDPGFAVSIALVAQNGTPQIGVVYDPSTDNTYSAIRGQGAFKNSALWQIKKANDHLSYVTDKKLKDDKRSDELQLIIRGHMDRLGISEFKEISGGGSVLNAIRVIENGPACMIKMPKKERGGGCIWDYAATSCIYQELGLKATDYYGNPLDLNPAHGPFMNEKGAYFSNLTF